MAGFDWKTFLIIQGLQTAASYGRQLKAQDSNTTGRDDAIGNLLVGGDAVAEAYLFGDGAKADAALKAVADGIYQYLSEKK